IATDLLLQERVWLGSTLEPEDERRLWHCNSCEIDFLCLSDSRPDRIDLINAYRNKIHELWRSYKPLTDQERETTLAEGMLKDFITGFLTYNKCAELRIRLDKAYAYFQVLKDGTICEWIPFSQDQSETLFPYLTKLVESALATESQFLQTIALPWRDGECPFMVSVRLVNEFRIIIIRPK